MEAVYASLVAAIAAIVSSLGTLWLQQRHSARMAKQQAEIDRERYKSERVWDAQKDAYSQLLRNLNDAAQKATFIDHGFHGEGANAHRFFESDLFKNTDMEMRMSWYRARAVYENEGHFFSSDFNSAFRERMKAFSEIYGDDTPSCYKEYKAVLKETHRIISDAVRKDIDPEGSSLR